MKNTDAARRVLVDAIAARRFPAAAVEAGDRSAVIWREAFGALRFDDAGASALDDTPFDLASLTKVIATSTAVMQLVHEGRLGLDELAASLFPEWRGPDREATTVADLLEHASGLPARLIERPPVTRREFEHDICSMPLEYPARAKSVYSDLGFVLLGFAVADRGGAPLAEQHARVWERLRDADALLVDAPLAFELSAEARRRSAPTRPLDEDVRRGRMLVGEVHDNYAAALGGVAGHAGLFGTAQAVGGFARFVLRAYCGDETVPPPFSPDLVRRFVAKGAVPGTSRALGWDTMRPTSSCGTRMTSAAFGHVGFTGTSLWIDPTRDRYFVLLTNRACGGGTSDEMQDVRRAFHDALGDL
jgi:CubicO group peptidase (beta-lactamase class C family)